MTNHLYIIPKKLHGHFYEIPLRDEYDSKETLPFSNKEPSNLTLFHTENFQQGFIPTPACTAIRCAPVGLPYYSKRRQLLQVKRKIHAKVCSEEGCDGDCEEGVERRNNQRDQIRKKEHEDRLSVPKQWEYPKKTLYYYHLNFKNFTVKNHKSEIIQPKYHLVKNGSVVTKSLSALHRHSSNHYPPNFVEVVCKANCWREQ